MKRPRKAAKVVRHSGRVTTAQQRHHVQAANAPLLDLTEATQTAVARARMQTAGHRIQSLVDASPEAAAAMRRLGGIMAPSAAQAMVPVYDVIVSADPATCLHPSASGIDMASPADPDKIWRCDSCGHMYRSVPDPANPGAHTQEPVR